jgi:restriction system protein
MSKDAVPTHLQLLSPTLEALKQMGGSGSNQEILDKVVAIINLPEEVQKIPHGSGTELGYRLMWARTYLRLFGALENSSRAVWSVTPKGQAMTEQDVSSVPAWVRKQFPPKKSGKTGDTEDAEQPLIEDAWRDRLLTVLQNMLPAAFERLSQRLLRESGFVNVDVKGKSGDGGIDGVGVLRVNLLSFQVLFQCKRYKGSVPAKDVRDFRGAMSGRTDKGLFITTGRFTADARREATREGAPPIDLVDGEQLCDLLKDLKIGVVTKTVEEVEIQPEVFKAV